MQPPGFRDLGRAISAIENREPPQIKLTGGTAPIVGITGPPGAGKSSLVDALTSHLRSLEKSVAILAVDPSSRATGGAILGDRIRMQRHHADRGVFIRSMATRGAMGGLAVNTFEAARLLRAAGFDYVFIETVGVGQDEVDIASVADVTVVVLVPGMGDDVQAIKAGVMEIADIFVINKSDMPGADKMQQEIEAMLSLDAATRAPLILRTVATEATGIAELIAAIDTMPRKSLVLTERLEIDHLGIAVKSLDAALPFYRELGFREEAREEVVHEKVSVAMLPAGTSRVELLEASDETSLIARYIQRRGEGIHHVALRVNDLRATVDRLRARGARLVNEPRQGAGGHLYVFVHPESTGGVLLELIQR
jgi:LAO/AO transport system kinase